MLQNKYCAMVRMLLMSQSKQKAIMKQIGIESRVCTYTF